MPEWKATVNLPRTGFPMKANLQTAEPEAIARWEAMDLYGQIRAQRRGSPKFVFHDGPPYANGQIHLGTALNKILKDIVIKSRTMAGFDVPYTPGYDCHGLPIELKVDRELGPKKREMSVADIRRACREYAGRFIDVMTAEFKRLMVFGDWDRYYLTMNPQYQADIARSLGKFVERGLVYKGKKPVHWCIHCRTALAEAEVEYADHSSPSIYVEFPLAPDAAADLAARIPGLTGRDVSVLIWTTTPWTIPSNLAVAFHPELDYAAYEVDGRAVILAEGLVQTVGKVVGRSFEGPIARMKGTVLEGVRFRHPLYERDSVGVLGDYVTLEAGTGAVHTAPGHGADDFLTGRKYGLEIYAPIGPAGHFLDTVELFGGQRVFDANPNVEQALKERSRLWHRETFAHQYPHCWRCHNPVIFLATSQWFVRMDGEPAITGADGTTRTLREAAQHAIDREVTWIPRWGRDRIFNMVSNRPDWCISRQRAWGVPIPAVDCASCGEAVLTTGLIDKAAAVFEQYNADAWYERPIEEFLPPGLTCPSCGGTSFERERDILDVWFDSWSSHEAVLARIPELGWPADMYLEGRKMSKSVGNVISPQDVIKESGAEIIRLWVASTEFTEELRVSKEILTRVVDVYRKLRNTCRILVANLYDFDPATDMVPLDKLEAVDRFALARYADAARRVRAGYDAYDFSTVAQVLSMLATVDLSAFYVDVTKDRMYTFGTRSAERRSTQTAMYLISDGLARLLAPILPVTADQLWHHLPGPRAASVHLERLPEAATYENATLLSTWDRLLAVREAVNAVLEQKRKDKVIGTSLGARVTIAASGPVAALLDAHRRELPMLFIVSDVVLRLGAHDGQDQIAVEVEKAHGVKCDRCWRFVATVRSEPEWAGICDRCVDALGEPGRSVA